MNNDTDEPQAKESEKKSTTKKKKAAKPSQAKRTRTARIYPALSFEQALVLAEAIHEHASEIKVSRLTLLKKMNMSQTSSVTQILITSSGKYGLTKGSYLAESIELTVKGAIASDKHSPPRAKAQARVDLAIKSIKPFDVLYERYKGRKLPSHEFMRDALGEAKLEVADSRECIDTFIVNAKFVGILQTIAGSETLVPVETLLEELPKDDVRTVPSAMKQETAKGATAQSVPSGVQWDRTCFYISAIDIEGSERRKHSDLFLSSIVEPALGTFDLDLVRSDRIGQGGMITSQIIEHLLRSKLVIADLSYHNPNVFYEMAIRHFSKLPIVQICRKVDPLPFDVSQVRTVSIDTTDIYTLVPKLQTYQSEIATQVRTALEGNIGSNPITVFFPGIEITIPR